MDLLFLISIIGLVCVIWISIDIYSKRKIYFAVRQSSAIKLSASELTVHDLPTQIPLSKLGTIEGSAKGLHCIIIFCDKIEDPIEDSSYHLLKSVKANFIRGVKYYFFVSPSNIHQQKSYYQIYEGYANALIQERKVDLSLEDLIEIKPLSSEWKNYPYIFYVCKDESNTERYLTFGLRGTQLREGIASSYRFLEPELAQTVLGLAVKANNSINIDVTLDDVLNSSEFVDEEKVGNNILEFKQRKKTS